MASRSRLALLLAPPARLLALQPRLAPAGPTASGRREASASDRLRGGTWGHALGNDARIGLVSMGREGFTAEFGNIRVWTLQTAH